jgi:hypothetical protein
MLLRPDESAPRQSLGTDACLIHHKALFRELYVNQALTVHRYSGTFSCGPLGPLRPPKPLGQVRFCLAVRGPWA